MEIVVSSFRLHLNKHNLENFIRMNILHQNAAYDKLIKVCIDEYKNKYLLGDAELHGRTMILHYIPHIDDSL